GPSKPTARGKVKNKSGITTSLWRNRFIPPAWTVPAAFDRDAIRRQDSLFLRREPLHRVENDIAVGAGVAHLHGRLADGEVEGAERLEESVRGRFFLIHEELLDAAAVAHLHRHVGSAIVVRGIGDPHG